jgi:hypothetical protein
MATAGQPSEANLTEDDSPDSSWGKTSTKLIMPSPAAIR